MAQQNSFDIVSQIDRSEMVNAINQTMKEVQQRFDFKGSKAKVELEEKELVLSAEDDTKLRNMNDILQQKLVRRGVPLKAFSYGNSEPAAGGTVRQRAEIQQGIPQDKAKEIVKFIKDSKAKVQSSIQGDVVISPAFLRRIMGQEVRDGCVTKVEVKEGIHGTRAGKRRPVRSTLEGPARPRLGIRSGAFPRVKVGCHIQQGNSFRVVGTTRSARIEVAR